MCKSWGSAAVVAVWLGAAATSVSQAKPPDLPAANHVRCEDDDAPGTGQPRFEWDATTRQLRPAIEGQAAASIPICIDGWCPSVLPFILESICERLWPIVPTGVAVPTAMAPRDAMTDDVRRGDPEFANSAEEARHLYELAARFARAGKLIEARACLRKAHLANPTCRFGRLAMQRLQELETIEPAEEASEPPPNAEPPSGDDMGSAEQIFQQMRQTTQPLGLVTGVTY